ncbi:MAG: FtsX-like permease family protein [Solirubrobacteraceae bacterium]
MRTAIAEVRLGLRLRRRRSLLAAIGIALAAAMLSAALVIVDSLGSGFDRAARAADLPDVIVRFDPQPIGVVASRIRALPDIAAFSTRTEVTSVQIAGNGHSSAHASIQSIGPGRRGYAIVAGRNLSSRFGEVVLERGLAQAWKIPLGATIQVDELGRQRVVGLAQSPDNVSYPLAVPRLYVSDAALDARFGPDRNPQVNLAQIWLRDRRYLSTVLVQARATSYGLRGLRFITRSGVRVLLDQAAGIVIDLLVALSVIALSTAGVMLAASARAEVQRRLQAIGVRRAVGAPRSHLALVQALEAAAVAVPAATLGLIAGALGTAGPSGHLLTLLNEPPAGTGLIPPLAAGWMASVAIPVLAAAWPAWRAAGRSPVALLEGAELSGTRDSGWRRLGRRGPDADPRRVNRPHRAGLAGLGARLVTARRGRLTATVLTLGVSAAFVLLMLALASALSALETDPGALGKRYQLSASLPAAGAARLEQVPGVQTAGARYEVQALDSFSLGETVDVIAYPGDHTTFEAPPLTGGRRLRGSGEAEVGAGLADALGLAPGGELALALPSGAELRLRVAGIVSSLAHDGRVAYIPAAALLKADRSAPEQIAIKLSPGADQARVSEELTALGVPSPTPAAGATARGAPLVDILRTILRAVAIIDGLVCLYALIQTCALTVQERRRTIAVLRATGASSGAVRRLLAGAALALVIPAAVVGVAAEQLVLGPALAHLAASYATLALGAGVGQVAAVLAGLLVAAGVAVLWVGRQATRETVVEGLAGA